MLNLAALIGRVTKDPVVKKSGDTTIASFGIAVNTGKEETSFFEVVAFNKKADLIKEYVHKGDQLGITGSLRQRTWETKEGKKASQVEIVLNEIQLLTPKKEAPVDVPDDELPFGNEEELPAGWHWENGKPVKDVVAETTKKTTKK